MKSAPPKVGGVRIAYIINLKCITSITIMILKDLPLHIIIMLLLDKNNNEITIKISLDTLLIDLKQLIENTVKKTIEVQHQIEPSPVQSDLLTRQQICKFLKISLPTLDARITDGSIPCFTFGKKILFDKVKVIESITRKRGKND